MKVLAEDKALVVREGNLDRHRVPSSILAAAGASFDTGDGIAWQVQDFGPQQGILIVGTLVKGARQLEAFKRTPPTPPQAQTGGAKKSGAKKGAAKKAGPAPAVALPPGIGGVAPAVPLVAPAVAPAVVDEDTEYLEDGPVAPVPAAAPRLPVAAAPIPKATAPAPVPSAPKGGKKSASKKGAVAYQIPGGLGGQFVE